MRRPWFLPIALLGLASAAAARTLPWPPVPSPTAANLRAHAVAALGKSLFFDPTLSASGHTACATCHDPAHAFAAPNALPVQPAGPDQHQQGIRAVPSLMYAQDTPPFTEHFHESEDEGDESVDQGPTGGRTWDGRVDRARDQAIIPLFDKNEMANSDPAAVTAKLVRAPYAAELRHLYGADVLATPTRAVAAITEALEFYLQTPATFSPFSSKYDAVLRGTAHLTDQEARGLALFNNPETANCAQCHKSAVTADGHPPLFTDFGFVALGVPRNPAIAANADPTYHDLGLCGPQRHDLVGHTDYCGMFKAPTLRNVALRQSFYHNGIFHTLRQAVEFYAERDTSPAKWYPTAPDGGVQKFNDLPRRYQTNISLEKPFGPKQLLSQADVDDIVAFLNTLTDGYRSAEPPFNPPPPAARAP